MSTKVLMPQLGESVIEGTISRWLKQVGDQVSEFDPLLEVSTDKVETEIPAPADGVLLSVNVQAGATVKVGEVLAVIGQPGEAPEVAPEAGQAGNGQREAEAAPPAAVAAAAPAARVEAGRGELGFISPVVAKLADEHQLDLYQIRGTGQGGRITKKDVLAFVEGRRAAPAAVPARAAPARSAPVVAAAPAAPQPAAGDFIPVEGMRKLIAEHMVRSKHTSPHVTTVFEADLSSVLSHLAANKEAFARDGVTLTLTAYFMAAATAALQAVPLVNSQWTDEKILLKREIHIGMAVALDDGLIVPVLKNAAEKSLLGLAREVNDLARRARARALKPDEVQGGTFTITNHGVSGSLFAAPIINQPQVGILGVGMMQKRVVVINDAIAIRPMVYLTLTFDHRVLDGAVADRFMSVVKKTLEEWA